MKKTSRKFDVTESTLYRLYRALRYIREQPSLRHVEYEAGIIFDIPGEHCSDECCREQLDLDDAIDALEDLLDIVDLSSEEIVAEEKRRFEEGRKRFLEKHPSCMSEAGRGPKDRESN